MTMISDDKRRKVAARIRELMSECLTIPFFMVIVQAINECLPEEGGAYALIVADLIDRPTCTMTYKPEWSGDEIYPTTAYQCSNCGCVVNEGITEYCPDCGCRVSNFETETER